MTMWKWIAAIAAAPIGAGVIVYGVGAMLPARHVAAHDALIGAPVAAVAERIRGVETQPQWRSGVKGIDVLERRPNGLLYVEKSGGDAIRFDFAEEQPGTLFRSTIADPELPFGGSWTISLTPEGNGTRVRIEEKGEVRNPIYRFFSALVFGHDGTIKTYLADLAKSFA